MDTGLTEAFGDGKYRFWLPMPRVVAIEREAGESILALFYNLGEHLGVSMGETVLAGPSPATLKQCQSVIRNALIGGSDGLVGGDQIAVGDALGQELVETYCYPARPAMHDIALAWRILKAAVYGVEVPAAQKKTEPAEEATDPS